jgi:restriction system protein
MTAKSMWGMHMELHHEMRPVEQGFLSIGWDLVGDLSKLAPTREAFKKALAEAYPATKPGGVPVQAGVLYRFAVEVARGDYVVYPSKPDRMINLGIIESDYQFDRKPDPAFPNRRKVKWLKSLPRTAFSQTALYEIGSAITLFQVAAHYDEFLAAFEGKPTEPEEVDDTTVSAVSAQVEESTEDFIVKRLKTGQSPYAFEHFVAHILICMGYRARVTKASGDGGIDIIAHKDELGFEPPIIKVQCKQTLEPIGRPDVQRLHGAIEQGEHGLFVTLGPFSNDAKTFERSKPNMRLIDGTTLIELIYTHYSKFEPRYQMLLPLKRVYIPGPNVPGST